MAAKNIKNLFVRYVWQRKGESIQKANAIITYRFRKSPRYHVMDKAWT
ncbi:hypothetical protein CHCC20335_3087 [Bacillus paralicheniformis]|nr:hypothetical protein CHCC20335_3087 [Bacillus paralicheniformis]